MSRTAQTRMMSFIVMIEYEDAKLKPSGPAERTDDGYTDVEAMVTHRIKSAFQYVDGFHGVQVFQKEWRR